MITRVLTCIGCPKGCQVEVTIEETKAEKPMALDREVSTEKTAVTNDTKSIEITKEDILEIKGNECPRGAAYAEKEVTSPTRTVTGTARVFLGTNPQDNDKDKDNTGEKDEVGMTDKAADEQKAVGREKQNSHLIVPCKTRVDVPKAKIFEVMEALREPIYLTADRIAIGDVLIKDAGGTGVDIVATKNFS